MDYNTALEVVSSLSYRDKLRLAQLLIQLARKEEEELSVKSTLQPIKELSIDLNYIKERLLKSRPSKLSSLENFIDAMFQFKGSISESKRNQIIVHLKNEQFIYEKNHRIIYSQIELK